MSHAPTLAEAFARATREPAKLAELCGLPAATVSALLPFYLPLAEAVALRQLAKGGPLTVGIQGPQGAGKTTLTLLLQHLLSEAGLRVATMSIDDLYLTRAERLELAARVHPLFMTRGVPGTHDVDLGIRVLDALTRPGRVAVPRFDKSQDDRMPEASWPLVEGPCDIVLFEGLWIGLPALADDALREPINELEAREDPAAVWRRHANGELATSYPALFERCELIVHIQVPDFGCVKRWRSAAEHTLRARLEASGADSSRVMDDTALARFFAHYERFTAHAMQSMPGRADWVLQLDGEHRPVGPVTGCGG